MDAIPPKPYCSSFCQHPFCWKAFSDNLKAVGNFYDNDVDFVSRQRSESKQPTQSQSQLQLQLQTQYYSKTNHGQSLEDSEEYFERPNLKTLWVRDFSGGIELPMNQIDYNHQFNSGEKHLLEYIDRKRKYQRSKTSKSDSDRSQFHKITVTDKVSKDYEYRPLSGKVLKWQPKAKSLIPIEKHEITETNDSPKKVTSHTHMMNTEVNLEDAQVHHDTRRTLNKQTALPTGGQPYLHDTPRSIKQIGHKRDRIGIDVFPIKLKPLPVPLQLEPLAETATVANSEVGDLSPRGENTHNTTLRSEDRFIEESLLKKPPTVDKQTPINDESQPQRPETIIVNYPIKPPRSANVIKTSTKIPNAKIKPNFAMIEDLFALNLYDPRVQERLKSADIPSITTPNVTIHSRNQIDSRASGDFEDSEDKDSYRYANKELLVCSKVSVQGIDNPFQVSSYNSFLTSSNLLMQPKNILRIPTTKLPTLNVVGFKSNSKGKGLNLALGPIKREKTRQLTAFNASNISSARATVSSNSNYNA